MEPGADHFESYSQHSGVLFLFLADFRVLKSISTKTFLANPDPKSFLEPEIGEIFVRDPARYRATAKEWTVKHAQ